MIKNNQLLILLALTIIGCSPTKVIIDISSNDFVNLKTFDIGNKSRIIAGLSFRDSININNKKISYSDKMYNSALVDINKSRIEYYRDDFSTKDNTIRIIDIDKLGNFTINGFAESNFKLDNDSLFQTEWRTFDYIVKYNRGHRLLYYYTLENRNQSHTSNYIIDSDNDFYYFNSVGDVNLQNGFIDHSKGNMNHSNNIVWFKNGFSYITDYQDTERYSNHKTGVSSIILINKSQILACITDVNSYKNYLAYLSDSLEPSLKIKLPAFSYFPDLKVTKDSIYLLGHDHKGKIHLLTTDKALTLIHDKVILDSGFVANSNKNQFEICEVEGGLYIIGLIHVSDNISDLIIWSLKNEKRLSYLRIENLNDIQYKLKEKKIYIGGNFREAVMIRNEKFENKGKANSMIIRTNWR